MKLKPHPFVADELSRGNCLHCGATPEHDRHAVTVVVNEPARIRSIEEELRVAREALSKLEDYHRERMALALKDLRELVFNLEQERIKGRPANV